MIVHYQRRARSRTRFAEEISWESYCAQTYAGNPDLIAKCNSKPVPCVMGVCPPFMAPWTVAGKAARGLPSNGGSVGPVNVSVGSDSGSSSDGAGDSIFGIPKTVFWGGLGVLGVGAAAMYFSKK